MYSFGICLWEILTRESPFLEIRGPAPNLRDAVREGLRPPLPAFCPPTYKCLMEACWSHRVRDRPTFQEITDLLNNIEACDEAPLAPAMA